VIRGILSNSNLANIEEALASDRFGYVPLSMAPPPPLIVAPTPGLGVDTPVFEELPVAQVVEVSRSEWNDISLAFQLVYTIECTYRQFTWRLERRAAEVILLHLFLKKRALLEELQEKQELVKEWVYNLRLGDQQSDINVSLHPQRSSGGEQGGDENNQSSKRGDHIPSSAVFPVMRPAFGRLPTISQRATSAMQNYLNHFLASLEIVNTREVCRFLEVSKLSFKPEYGPKLREGYVMVHHLSRILLDDENPSCCSSFWMSCRCWLNTNWQQVWLVLKPGFLALLADPLDVKALDIILFDVLPSKMGNPRDAAGLELKSLAIVTKEKNPLRFSFTVNCGNRAIKMRTAWATGARDWVTAINDAVLKPSECGWCHPHRFQSFAPERGITDDGSEAQWFVDGKAAFEAIALAIEDARTEIFITGWWLCPELYLQRPFRDHEASRLDRLLESKAKMGVRIYILLYKEVSMALKINSTYSKQRLLAIHENIKVLRWPDHFSSGVYLWSHHEKLVIVDSYVCFLGGLDMCFGRYDDPEHRVSDNPPTIWPGKDYYNPRESEPNSWEDVMRDELDRNKFPRMPWHDVHCAIWGPSCRDVARHFVQRWNYAKRNKAPNRQTIPLLLPCQHMVIPHYLTGQEEAEAKVEAENAIQQASDQEKLASYVDIPLLLPKEPEAARLDSWGSGNLVDGARRDAIGISPSRGSENLVDGAQRDGIGISPLRGSGRVVPHKEPIPENNNMSMISQMPTKYDFVESLVKAEHAEESRDKESMREALTNHEWFESDISDDHKQIFEIGPRSRCKIQVIRSVGHWSAGTSQAEEQSIHAAYCSLIEKAENFIYIENQFFISGLEDDETIQNRVLQALYMRIMRAHKEAQVFRVIVVMPLLPGFQGGVDDVGAASVRFIMHWQYRTICKGKHSLLQKLEEKLGSKVEDFISFYGLRNHGRLHDNGPLATSQVYVHSKLMIVDDRFVLIGSANINDRSLLGSRDSEMGVVLEDLEQMDSMVNGKPSSVGPFAHSLRISLWAEHLGLQHSELHCIKDPVCDTTFKEIWMLRARNNTSIYQAVFECIPADTIHSRAALRQAAAHRKEKVGHTTIDLGIALEQDFNEEISSVGCRGHETQLNAVHGHVVNFPLHFMSEEDLRPVFKESEYYAFPQIFY
jgi:phospholipase D1/2